MNKKSEKHLATALILTLTLQTIPTYVFATEIDNTPSVKIQNNEIINIPDNTLKEILNDSLGQPSSSDITKDQLESITSLDVNNKAIYNLEGLQYCKNLVSLRLHGCSIRDITPLSNLTKLKDLNLYDNQIRDISALSTLTNLENLILTYNKIIDISALNNLNTLKTLSINYNEITSINALKNLTNLQELFADQNKINDITSLYNLTNLERLSLGGNSITDVSSLELLSNLIYLNLADNNFSNISSLSNLTKLQSLSLYGVDLISDISSLSNLTSLSYLDISDNKINDIKPLSNLIKLEVLNAFRNDIRNLTPLSNLSELTSLDLKYNNINALNGIENLSNLKTLGLSDNPLESIDSLKTLKNLKILYLDNCNTSNLTSLESSINLQTLWLSGNKIKDTTPLKNLTNLKTLYLNNNEINDISPLLNIRGDIRLNYQNIYSDMIETLETTIEIHNPLKDLWGDPIKPKSISHNGTYNESSNTIKWDNIQSDTSLSFNFALSNDSIGNFSGTVYQEVKHITNEKPVISGAKDKTINAGDKFDPMDGVTALDKEDGNLTSKITVSGNVDTSKPGKYNLTYSVEDNNGNITTENIIITVVAVEIEIKSAIGVTRYDTAVKLSKLKFNEANTIVLVNGNALADGLAATPLAAYKNAPILLSTTSSLPEETKDEIKRLGAKNIIIAGGTGVVDLNVESELKTLGIETIERLGGLSRYDTSLQIAKYIDTYCYPVKNIVVSNGHGAADALSISSVAGRDNMPIILVETNTIHKDVYSWLSSKKLKNAYIIGGEGVVSNTLLNTINSITSDDISDNRLGGLTRYETNAMVINKFFTDKLDTVYVSKGIELIDALASGPVAALSNAPVVLVNDDLSDAQINVLDKKQSTTIIKAGGGISEKAVESLKKCLN